MIYCSLSFASLNENDLGTLGSFLNSNVTEDYYRRASFSSIVKSSPLPNLTGQQSMVLRETPLNGFLHNYPHAIVAQVGNLK